MAKAKRLKITTTGGEVSALLEAPAKPIAAITLAHGAGAGMEHEFLSRIADELVARGFAVLRFQFPYMEAGRGRPDRPPVAMATVAAAVGQLKKKYPKLPLFAAGKSFGARMTTNAAAEGLLALIDGIVCYGFPLHMPKKPDVKRAEHLARVKVPMLFLQGTRDDLADLKLIKKVCAKLPRAHLHVVEGGDHSFAVLKRSGRTFEQVLEELAGETLRFARR